MKMKEVCSLTGLTERTIRFYVEEGLLTPETHNNNGRTYLNFTEDNISELETLAALRRARFSLSEIIMMKREPQRIPEIAGLMRSQLRQQAQETDEMATVLEASQLDGIQNITELAGILSRGKVSEPVAAILEPDFGRFDGIPKKEKDEAYHRFLVNTERRAKRRGFLCAACAAIVLVFISVMVTLFAAGVLPSKDDDTGEATLSDFFTVTFTADDFVNPDSDIDFPLRAYPESPADDYSFSVGGIDALSGNPVSVYSDSLYSFSIEWDVLNSVECGAVDELELPLLTVYGDESTEKNRLEIIVPGRESGEYFGIWLESAALTEEQMIAICRNGIHIDCLWDGGFSGTIIPNG